jgi:hypothetical protein
VSLNVWRLAGDTLNITCNFLYCNHQVRRDFLIALYIRVCVCVCVIHKNSCIKMYHKTTWCYTWFSIALLMAMLCRITLAFKYRNIACVYVVFWMCIAIGIVPNTRERGNVSLSQLYIYIMINFIWLHVSTRNESSSGYLNLLLSTHSYYK